MPWWPEERRHPSLHRVLVHLTAGTHRHAGHADVLRELVDGAVGDRAEFGSSVGEDPGRWGEHRARVQAVAEQAAVR
nr:DUF664 domain-containing protein [Modestobacter excelsi]